MKTETITTFEACDICGQESTTNPMPDLYREWKVTDACDPCREHLRMEACRIHECQQNEAKRLLQHEVEVMRIRANFELPSVDKEDHIHTHSRQSFFWRWFGWIRE